MNPGSGAYEKIWAAIARIPRGKVATYGQIAALAGFPRQPRLAGYALANCPRNTKLCWQRVINAQGKISFPPRSAAYRKQKSLLEKEGVALTNGRVSLTRYRWKPLDESPLLD